MAVASLKEGWPIPETALRAGLAGYAAPAWPTRVGTGRVEREE